MSKEIANPHHCVLIRGGIELWVESGRKNAIEDALSNSANKFIRINGQLVNTFEVLGVFTADAMEERTRRKNGEWRCQKGNWHEQRTQCNCRDYKEEVVAYVDGVGEVRYKR